MHRNPKTLTTLGSSGTKRLLPSRLLGFSTRGEKDTIFIMLTVSTSFFSPPPTELSAQNQNLNSLIQQTRAHPVAHKLDSPRPASNLN